MNKASINQLINQSMNQSTKTRPSKNSVSRTQINQPTNQRNNASTNKPIINPCKLILNQQISQHSDSFCSCTAAQQVLRIQLRATQGSPIQLVGWWSGQVIDSLIDCLLGWLFGGERYDAGVSPFAYLL